MRIAIDALGISRPGGGRSATLNLLQPLLADDQQDQYLVFVDSAEPSLVGLSPHARQIIAPTRQRIGVRIWAQVTWPTLLRRERVQLLHHTKNLVTFGNPCPTVVTIHDLTILVHPEMYPALDVLFWRSLQPLCLRAVSHIIAVSQVTADDLVLLYGMPRERITIIPEGIDDVFQPVDPARIERARARYSLPERYILHVGSISPKKNLATLARAYGRLVRQEAFDGALVLVGRSYWPSGDAALDAEMASAARGGRIIRTGAVPQEDLPALYSGAAVFAFPSLHEGFGLVPLEAMACGVPVVASRVGAVEDMAAEAVLYVDEPRDDVELAVQLERGLNDGALRDTLRSAGLERARRFSRLVAARRTLELYKQLAG